MAYRMCPECKTQVKIREVHLGRELHCPVCKTRFEVIDTCPSCGAHVAGARCECGEIIPLVPAGRGTLKPWQIGVAIGVAVALLALIAAIVWAAR